MKSNIFITFILLIIFQNTLSIETEECFFTTEDGLYSYDFSDWQKLSPVLVSDGLGVQNHSYIYQPPCSSKPNSIPEACKESSVCIGIEDSRYINGGKTDSAVWSDADVPSAGVVITYTNGAACSSMDSTLRKTTVLLSCYVGGDAPIDLIKKGVDPVSGLTYIANIDDADECAVLITVYTPLACPINQPADPICEGLLEDDCLAVEGCYCGMCDGRCVAYYEQCEAEREFDCSNQYFFEDDYNIFDLLLLGLCFLGLILSCCLCCVACCRPSKRVDKFPQQFSQDTEESQIELLQPVSTYVPPYFYNPPVGQALDQAPPVLEIPPYWNYPGPQNFENKQL